MTIPPNTAAAPPQAHIAGTFIRLIAALYDGMLVLALMALVGLIVIVIGTNTVGDSSNNAQPLPAWYRHWVLFPSYFIATWTYYAVCWRKVGQTLGMQTWHLKTVHYTGNYLTLGQGYLRCMSACILPMACSAVAWRLYGSSQSIAISFIIGFILNYAVMGFTPKNLSVHDIISRSLTVKVDAPVHISLWSRVVSRLRSRL